MQIKLPSFCVAGLVITFFVSPAATATNGGQLIGVGAVQKGTAGAGIASPQDATWALLNPASIVDLDARFDLSLDLIKERNKAFPMGALANPNVIELKDSTDTIAPSTGIILPLKVGTLGFGIFGTRGNITHYQASRSSIGALTNEDRTFDLRVAKAPITYAYQFDNGWAVGGSLVGVLDILNADALTPDLTITSGHGKMGAAVGMGLQIGVYKRWDRWSIGAKYLSKQYLTNFSRYNDLITTNLDEPQEVQAGLAFRPTDWLELVADYQWIDWSGVGAQSRSPVNGGLGWSDQHIVKVGALFRPNAKWTFRVGVSTTQSPIGPEEVFANILTPAITKTHLGVGCSYVLDDHWEFHFAYTHAFNERLVDNGQGDALSQASQGTSLSARLDTVAVQATYKFGGSLPWLKHKTAEKT